MTRFASRHWSARTGGGLFMAALGLVVAMVTAVPSAQADPHATFYTVIGQQQLFFNVLAALDQADYVESDLLRDNLLLRRIQAGFRAEQDPLVAQTRTNLSSILTRSVTLEGDDVWSAYLAHNFALEMARRRGLGEVLQVYCERGLGRENCNDNALNNPNKWLKDQSEAFANLPYQTHFVEAVQRGMMGIVNSGEDEQYRQKVIYCDRNPNDVQTCNGFQREWPVAYDHDVAELKGKLQQQGKGNVRDDFKLQLLRSARSVLPTKVDATAYDDITLDADGNVQLAFAPPGATDRTTAYAATTTNAQDYIFQYINTLMKVTSMPNATLNAVLMGQTQVSGQIEDLVNDSGTLANFDLYAAPGANGQGTGPIHARVNTPASVVQSQAEQLNAALVQGNIDLKYANPAQQATYGTVRRTSQGAQGQVSGIQSGTAAPISGAVLGSTTSPTQGAVAGVRDDPDFGRTLPRLDPNTDAAFIHHEYPQEWGSITGQTNCGSGYCISATLTGNLQATLSAIGP